MNYTKAVVLVLIVVMSGAVMAIAAQDEASREKGKTLFNDPALGTTGKSCNDCHPGGKGAEKAATKDDAEIARIVNACITHSIRGKALDVNSVEMRSLVLYIKSFGDDAKSGAPKKAPVGC
jgi:cytochrome c peroxidase